LSVEPLDMRAGTETILARVVQVFGAAMPHHAYLFANRRGNRMKVLVHNGHGVWLANRRLNQGRFHWRAGTGDSSTIPPGLRRYGVEQSEPDCRQVAHPHNPPLREMLLHETSLKTGSQPVVRNVQSFLGEKR
jgi:transposase